MKHYLGFFGLGLFLLFLPDIAVGSLRSAGPNVGGARALWLTCMGGIQALLGGFGIARRLAAARPIRGSHPLAAARRRREITR
ncbi:MAG: hypothetical protein ACREFX_00595 [Opitutaceae bacterium]